MHHQGRGGGGGGGGGKEKPLPDGQTPLGKGNKIIHKWNDKPFLDLYQGTIDEKTADVASVKNLSSILNTKFHESTPVFTKDLKTVYFTRNNYNKGKFRKATNGINKLKIYSVFIF